MNAADIAHALAGRRAQRLSDGNYLVPCPVPSHGKGHGDRRPSLKIGDGAKRVLVHCFAGCDPRDVLDELRRRGLVDETIRIQPSPRADDLARRQREKAAWLWSRHQSVSGTIAATYLHARGFTGPFPPTLGYLPPAKPEHHPALIAAFGVPEEAEPGRILAPRGVTAVHLTMLRPDGSDKAPVTPAKIVVGSPAGLPIVLAPPNDLLGLAVCEGIEDALTAHQATGLGAWAAGSAGFMPALADTVPGYVDCVTIYAHADPAGQRGARALANAIRQRGIQVLIEGDGPWRKTLPT